MCVFSVVTVADEPGVGDVTGAIYHVGFSVCVHFCNEMVKLRAWLGVLWSDSGFKDRGSSHDSYQSLNPESGTRWTVTQRLHVEQHLMLQVMKCALRWGLSCQLLVRGRINVSFGACRLDALNGVRQTAGQQIKGLWKLEHCPGRRQSRAYSFLGSFIAQVTFESSARAFLRNVCQMCARSMSAGTHMCRGFFSCTCVCLCDSVTKPYSLFSCDVGSYQCQGDRGCWRC